MHSLLVAQNCNKHFPLVLMSESPCCPITPFHVALSMPKCALKSLKRTRDSDEVAFPNTISTSSRKALYCDSMLGVYTCNIHRYILLLYATLALEYKPFLPVIPIQRRTQPCWGSQASQHRLEQTLLDQHRSRKFSTHRSTR